MLLNIDHQLFNQKSVNISLFINLFKEPNDDMCLDNDMVVGRLRPMSKVMFNPEVEVTGEIVKDMLSIGMDLYLFRSAMARSHCLS